MNDDDRSDRDDGGFFSRWSRRKVRGRLDPVADVPPPPIVPAALPAQPPHTAVAGPDPCGGPPDAALAAAEPPPTLADVAALTGESDYRRFVAPGVDGNVKNAALKKLFTDPHFNVMDGLDTYIDDYGLADPLPAGMLRQMVQSTALGLFADETPAEVPPVAAAPVPAAAPLPETTAQPSLTPDEDPALRLQPNDAAGPPGAGGGAGPHPGREC